MVFVNLWLTIINDLCICLHQWGLETGGPGARTPLEMRFCREKIFQIRKVSFFVLLGPPPAVWPESLGPKTPKGNLKTPKKNTTLKTRKHHVFGYKNTKYLIKSFKNGPPKHFYCIFVYQFLKNFNFFTEIFQKISIFF